MFKYLGKYFIDLGSIDVSSVWVVYKYLDKCLEECLLLS